MKRLKGYYLCTLLLLSQTCFSYTQNNTENYWQCNSYDQANNTWTGTNAYEKVAKTEALDLCKKNSTAPATCMVDPHLCKEFNQDKNARPRYQCTSFDQTGAPWLSEYFQDRDSAAFDALNVCKMQSKIPHTCFINLITCFIMIEGAKTQ